MLVHLFVCLLINLNQVGISMLFCCKLSATVQVWQWKNFANRSMWGKNIDRLIVYSLWAYILEI